RSEEKFAKTIEEVKEASGNESISGFIADFSDLSAVMKMADQVNDELDTLDVLINNAGVYNSPEHANGQGLDMRMVVNYLAPFVLTKALLPLCKKGDARIINVSSAAQAPVDPDVLAGSKRAATQSTYAQSKLALTMWSMHLAGTEKDTTVIAVNPGSLLRTKMVMEAFGNSWSSADKGADILYDLALSDDYRDASGRYYDNDTDGFNQAHPDAYDENKIDRLMRETKDIISG
ncbi:MAG: SDR family NAD(P)-dependent oxidoreductase, partial [Cyclobacteriaceae bacterium]